MNGVSLVGRLWPVTVSLLPHLRLSNVQYRLILDREIRRDYDLGKRRDPRGRTLEKMTQVIVHDTIHFDSGILQKPWVNLFLTKLT